MLRKSLHLHKRQRAFTLIEILIAVALTGLVASLALAPVVYAVRQVTETETAYANEAALQRTAAFMAQDVAAGLRLASTVVRTVGHEQFGGAGHDDVLVVASSAPAKQNRPSGSVIYKIVPASFMNDSIPGLYRWVLAGVLPGDVEIDKLEAKDAQLVTPYVTSLQLSVFEPPEWVSDYEGAIPGGLRFGLSRGEESVEYVCSFPQ
ncbi:MAG: prepilin-type N-terminal cleavage/methylation domain-containing protein [Synergistaceae bacterium]|nr:prepilin-type N-terminal cleavage/methylation domain-containing protein [Synergistaceae bacterium]